METINFSAWLDSQFFGYSVQTYLTAVATFVVVWIVLWGLVKALGRGLYKVAPDAEIREQIKQLEGKVRGWFYAVASLLVAIQRFTLPQKAQFTVNFILSSLILVQVLILVSSWVRFWFSRSRLARTPDGEVRAISQSLATVLTIAVWFLAFLILLDNFGFNVATLLAGLGVGGIAIGLALQSVLGDMFASFVIGLDRPFERGDFIIVGDFMGTVDQVGLKTTRIRSLGGELLVFSNNDLVSSRIRNYKQMNERRILFRFGVTYGTDQKMLEQIPGIVKSIVESLDDTRFDRAHFATFGAYSLDFEVVYYALRPDYGFYMDTQQQINLRLRQELTDRGVSFAFPTTTLDIPENTVDRLASGRGARPNGPYSENPAQV